MESQFYLIVSPGLEPYAGLELKEKWSLLFGEDLNFNEQKGGLSFSAPLEKAVLLNHYLKIPTRLLLRVSEFKCRDFPKLYQKLIKIPWNQYLRGQIPELEFSAKESRLFDSRKAEKVLEDALSFYYKAQPPRKATNASTTQKLYLRFENDVCTVSLDTSGERLERRGYRTNIGEAPLRESLASGLLLALKNESQTLNASTLIDPMCGSGTFLLESALYYAPSPREDYSYIHFPCLASLPRNKKKNLKDKGLFEKALGKDISPKVLEAAKTNASQAKLELTFQEEDFFKDTKNSFQDPCILICNPPYGERLDEGEITKSFFDEFLKMAKAKYNPEYLGILIPDSFGTPKSANIYKLKTTLSLSNGGIPVHFFIFKK